MVAIKSKSTQNSKATIGIENNDGNIWKNATNASGQTYFSIDGKEWLDIKELESQIASIKDANACIKAFTEESSLGDINLDEEFDLIDLSMMLQYFSNNLKQELPEQAYENLDLNKDGEKDLRDLSKMILIFAHME